MGTSHAAAAPNRKDWSEVAGRMLSPLRSEDEITSWTLTVAVDAIPSNFLNEPVAHAIYQGIKFALSVKKFGITKAADSESIKISEKYPIHSTSHALWQKVKSKADPKTINSPYGKITETAFKKTLSSIMTKGTDAME